MVCYFEVTYSCLCILGSRLIFFFLRWVLSSLPIFYASSWSQNSQVKPHKVTAFQPPKVLVGMLQYQEAGCWWPAYLPTFYVGNLPSCQYFWRHFHPPFHSGLTPRIIGTKLQHFMLAILASCQHSMYVNCGTETYRVASIKYWQPITNHAWG